MEWMVEYCMYLLNKTKQNKTKQIRIKSEITLNCISSRLIVIDSCDLLYNFM